MKNKSILEGGEGEPALSTASGIAAIASKPIGASD